jgi:putative ABC transport system permease protein
MLTDIKQGIRSFRRALPFTAAIIGILGLGIGLATAVFTVADAVLIRRLPVVDQDRIVVLSGEAPRKGLDNVPLEFSATLEFERRTRTLSRVAFFLYNGAVPITVREGQRISRLQEALVSGNYFDVLGAPPLIGRLLRAEDGVEGAKPVVVLSYRAWQQRFGGAADVPGRQIFIQEYARSYAVIGVAPPGIDYPRGTDAWVALQATIPSSTTKYLSLNLLGRLTAGHTASDARNEMTAFFHREGVDKFFEDVRGVVRPLPELVLGDTRPAVIVFAAAAGLLLLITCVNVANLLLVRGLARIRDVAVRSALGANRARIAVQLLTENAILASIGGALGVTVAWVVVRAFVAVAPSGTPRLDEISMNGATFAAAFAITSMAMLLFSVAPIFLASSVDVQQVLRSDTRQSASRRSRLVAELLVSGQIALAVLVLSAAGLVGRSLLRLQHADLAFNPTHVVVAELAIEGNRYDTGEKESAAIDRLVALFARIPGVQDVSPTTSVPYATTRSWEGKPTAEGQSKEDAARNPMLDIEVVGPELFGALGLPVTRGRAFSDADSKGSTPVVILSESAARFYWPNANPVGKRLVDGAAPSSFTTVIGVVPDTRFRDLREPHATIYYPLRQSQFPFAPTTMIIRTSRTAGDLAAALRTLLASETPGVALAKIEPFETLLGGPLAEPRLNAMLLMLFGASAVILAGVGLFGVLATMVRQRRRELGIRIALGAAPEEVARLVVGRGLLLATLGTGVGLLGALAANRLLASLLFQVTPTDALTLSIVAVVLVVVAAIASAIPARTSSRIEPAIALRAE